MVSPLTESVLGETLLTVTEEKVSITQLQAQVVASLALSLRPSPGSSHTILATAAAQQTLSFLKQVTGCPAYQPGAWSVEGGLAGSGLPVCHERPKIRALGNGRSLYPPCPVCLLHPTPLRSARGAWPRSCFLHLPPEVFLLRLPPLRFSEGPSPLPLPQELHYLFLEPQLQPTPPPEMPGH